jgi:hypothetical protein
MPRTRDDVFKRITVDHVVVGGTRISWGLQDTFKDTGPYTYQLQVGETGVAGADDWTNVGAAQVDVFFIVDSTRHLYGNRLTHHYRLQLTTSSDSYTSKPAPVYGLLSKRDWLLARAIIRRELLRHEKKASPNGYLLRRKWTGTVVPDPDVVDPLTGEIVKVDNTSGEGTEFVGGYYAPVAMFVDLSPETNHVQRDQNRGAVNDLEVQGRAIAFPQLNRRDIWVSATSDRRYKVQRIQNVAEIRAVPLVVNLALRPIPFKDPAYDVDVPT